MTASDSHLPFRTPSRWQHQAVGKVRCSGKPKSFAHCSVLFSFRTSLAAVLREMQLFQSIDSFCKILERANELDNIPLSYFVQHYKTTRPAASPLVTNMTCFGAWSYAINRLPPNVTETYHFALESLQSQPSMHRRAKNSNPISATIKLDIGPERHWSCRTRRQISLIHNQYVRPFCRSKKAQASISKPSSQYLSDLVEMSVNYNGQILHTIPLTAADR